MALDSVINSKFLEYQQVLDNAKQQLESELQVRTSHRPLPYLSPSYHPLSYPTCLLLAGRSAWLVPERGRRTRGSRGACAP